MKKLLVSLTLVLVLLSAAALAEVKTGSADGFGGAVEVSVTVEDGKIVAVTVDKNDETPSIAGEALTLVPEAIVKKGTADVDVVAGATYTSKAIMEAVKIALGESEVKAEEALPESDYYMGLGVSSMGRVGPGKDDKDVQVYSFNQVLASVVFDKEGKIVSAHIDQVEVATPNYDGVGMPHFTGFPGQSYNYDENHDEKVDSVREATKETFMEEIAGWATKRDRGDSYKMNTTTWAKEMDKYQEVFQGKTVEEVYAWFEKYCSSANGRPLTEKSDKEGDQEKWGKLTDEEKAMLADVTTTATMSLNDAHGNVLEALSKAFANRQPLNLK